MAMPSAAQSVATPPAGLPAAERRLWGVDMGRVLAAGAVVVIHACAAGAGVVRPGTVRLRETASFAVPFFLATAAVFAVRSITPARSAGAVARQRLSRLVGAYVTWSVIYLGLKAISAPIAHDPERVMGPLRDPGRLVVLGGASVQLYFLPMLAVGIALLPIVDTVSRRLRSPTTLVTAAAVTLVPYWWLGHTANAYDIATATGLRQLVDPHHRGGVASVTRVGIVLVVWAARLLPYLALAVLVNRFLLHRRSPRLLVAVMVVVFTMVEVAWRPFQPHLVRELAVSFPLLIVCVTIPAPPPTSTLARLVSRVAGRSLGIFLVHTAILQVVQDTANRLRPGFLDQISPAKVAVTAAPTFLLAWLATEAIGHVTPLNRLLLPR